MRIVKRLITTVNCTGCLLLILLVMPVETQSTGMQDILGVEWNGSEDTGWNFTMIRRENSNTFDYRATNIKDKNKKIKGSITVEIFKSKVKISKVIDGKNIGICDGIFSSDKRFISGLCYDPKKSAPDKSGTYSWWATVEHSREPKTPLYPLDINLATVKELETYLSLEPVSARNIVDHKLTIGSYKDIKDLLKYKVINAKTFERIKTKISVK